MNGQGDAAVVVAVVVAAEAAKISVDAGSGQT